eukprot:93906_1
MVGNWIHIIFLTAIFGLSLLVVIFHHYVLKNKAVYQWVMRSIFGATLGEFTRKHAKKITLEWVHQNGIPEPQVTFEKRLGKYGWKTNNTACDPPYFWIVTVTLAGKTVQARGQKKKMAELKCYQTLLQYVMSKPENTKNNSEINQLKKSNKTLESKYVKVMSKHKKLLKTNTQKHQMIQEIVLENKLNNNIQQEYDQVLKINNELTAKNKLYESMIAQNNNIKQKYDQLLKTNNELIAQNKLYESKIAQNNIICSQYKRLQNEHKELEIEYAKVKEELKKAANNCNKSRNMWQTEDVVNWIININKGKYNKYFNDLMRNMVKENIDGDCLNDLDKTDLHRLGITDYKDKRDIYQSIQQLIKGSNIYNNFKKQVEGHNDNAMTVYS